MPSDEWESWTSGWEGQHALSKAENLEERVRLLENKNAILEETLNATNDTVARLIRIWKADNGPLR